MSTTQHPEALAFCWATELAMTQQPVTLSVTDAREVSAEMQRLHAESEMRRTALLDEMQKAAQQHAENETMRAKIKAYEDLDKAASDVQLLRMGYAAARLEIESLQARIKTMAEEHADELMVAHMDGIMRVAQPAGAQQPCPTCTALARTVMLDQVSFDRKPDCYGIRQITDDEGVEEWEDIRTSPDVAREEANDMMATGRGEIYEVVPLWTTPQPTQAQEPVAWYVTGCGRLLDEDEAKAEARHIGGTARAMPLYTAPQADSQPAPMPDWLPFSKRMQIADRHGVKVTAEFNALVRDVIQTYLETHADRAARTPADSVLEDAARLDWLLLRISGAEFRRIGVHYSGNASRADVDAARKQGANHD